jgi:hypothetical protein
VPVIAGIAGAVVLLLVVVVAVVLSQRSGPDDTMAGAATSSGAGTSSGAVSSSGSSDPGDITVGTGVYPDAQELGLLTLLPDEYGADSVCQRWSGPVDSPLLMHRPVAAIFCTPSGGSPEPPDSVVFVRYSSDTESEMTFDVVFPEVTGGDCVADAPMATTYSQPEGTDAGYVGCQIADDGTAYVVWTRTGRGVYAYGSSDTGRIDALYAWFLSARAAIA